MIDSLARDVRYAIRGFLKVPAFSLAVVTTLALGVGASTAIFSMVDGILLKPLPLVDPNRLIYINELNPLGRTMSVAWPTYLDWTARATTVSALAASRDEPVTLAALRFGDGRGGVDRPLRITTRRVTASFLDVVGTHPAIGRAFSVDADRPSAQGEVMLSDPFWRTHAAADPNVIGATAVVDGVPFTVVGILPAGFQYLRPYDAFISMGPISGTAQMLERGNHSGFSAVGRLKAGVSVEAADKEFKAISSALEREYPKTNAGVTSHAEPLARRLVADIRATLLALLGAVGCLLLIACVNVANLLIARGATRRHELAVRAAIGGSRARIAAQLLVESSVISAVGAALGVAVAFALLRVLVAVAPEGTPRIHDVHLDQAALLFAIGAAGLCGLVFGLFPAAVAWRADAGDALMRMRSASASAGSQGVRRSLVVIETALAIVLLTGAGLTMRTVAALTRVDTGFRTERLLTMRVVLNGESWTDDRLRTAHRDLTARVRALPGITAAALAYSLPIDGSQWNSVFVAADRPAPVRAETPSAAMSPVGIGYFETLGMRIVSGRVFDDRDTVTSARVVIVNESLANRIWPGENAVGKRLKQGWYDSNTQWREVVGVVGDVKFEGVAAETPMQVYWPLSQQPSRSLAIIVRTSAEREAVARSIEAAVHAIDKDVPVYAVRTMDQVLETSIARQRMALIIFGMFAGVALILAAVGLYGVVSHGVTERTYEVGVRMALGASPFDVLALVVRQGLAMAAIGVAVGIVAAAALSRTIEDLLFGVSPTDPATLAGVAGVLLAVAAIACCVPAIRAARLDPTRALRAE